MRKLVLLVCALSAAAAPAAVRRAEKAAYLGGTLKQIAKGTPGTLDCDDEKVMRFVFKNATYELRYDQINSLRFGQKSRPLLLARRTDDILTIEFTSEEGGAGVMILELAKGVARAALPTLEARSGKKVEPEKSEPARSASATPAAPAASAAMPQYTLGALTFTSQPPGASVTVDGYVAGRTPTLVKLLPGTYTVTVHASGFQPWTQKLTVEPGETRKLGVELAAITK